MEMGRHSHTTVVTQQHISNDHVQGLKECNYSNTASGLAPVPPKLVAKIHKLEFVDMAELL